jgi:hypothetical protein
MTKEPLGFELFSRFWLDIEDLLLHLNDLLPVLGINHPKDNDGHQHDEKNEWRTFNQLNYEAVPLHQKLFIN